MAENNSGMLIEAEINKIKNFTDKCLFLLNERCCEIKGSVSTEISLKLNSYIPEAQEIWNSAIKLLRREKKVID